MKTIKRKIALTVVVALGALSSTSYAQPQDDIAKQFVGMWRLVSWPQRLADGTMRQNPLGAGYIIYTDTNHMCYVNMNPNRPKWNWATAPTETQALSGMGNTGFNAYCATVEIHANEGFVLHHVDVDKVPNNVGRIRKRRFTLQGRDRVSLRIDIPELNPPVVESTLTWERVTK